MIAAPARLLRRYRMVALAASLLALAAPVAAQNVPTPRVATVQSSESGEPGEPSEPSARRERRDDGPPPEPEASSPGYVLVIHADNPTTSLPRARVAKMFRHQIKSWQGLELPVVPVDQLESSEVRAAFTQGVHGKKVTSIEEFWIRMIFSGRGTPPKKLASDADVLAFVRSDRGAIGYVSSDTELGPEVKVLTVTD